MLKVSSSIAILPSIKIIDAWLITYHTIESILGLDGNFSCCTTDELLLTNTQNGTSLSHPILRINQVLILSVTRIRIPYIPIVKCL
jgi:hypothetical protein